VNTTDPSELLPIGLERTKDRHLVIQWQDGMEQRIPFRVLRDGCRCANCTEKHQLYKPVDGEQKEKPKTVSLPVLSLAETMPVEIVTMHPAGNYGYKISFSDGHSTGIYSFELLRSLGSKIP
jgi:DUF971 family protein